MSLELPIPTVISNEYKLTLLYYYNKEFEPDGLGYAATVERSTKDTGIASIRFTNHLIYKFGYPNVEALEGHTYYSYGLEPHKVFEVIESDWISTIEKMNRVHPFHDPQKIKSYRHFVIVFNDWGPGGGNEAIIIQPFR